MQQYAIFVDYGYVRAVLSSILKCPHSEMNIDIQELCLILNKLVSNYVTNARLLRFYFYDGAIPNTEMNTEHSFIARSDNITLKLGPLRRNPNGSMRQKGVDGLIVTDILSLAQNRAISDAFILGGDEDLVLGLVYAKAVGTRLHIVSVDSKTNNVAMRLIEEADTHIHISESEAQKICSRIVPLNHAGNLPKSKDISGEIKEYYDSLSDDAKTQLSSLNPWSLPGDIDSAIGGVLRAKFGIMVDFKEKKKEARQMLIKLAKSL